MAPRFASLPADDEEPRDRKHAGEEVVVRATHEGDQTVRAESRLTAAEGVAHPRQRFPAGEKAAGRMPATAAILVEEGTNAPAFGEHGLVTFLGGTNDDLFTGMLSIARLFVVSGQGSEPWRHNAIAAAAASRRRLDVQTSAIASLGRCIQSREARFLFLNDFLATDLHGGRDVDRAAMMAARRAAVEAAGGTFVDLFEVFGPEAGVSWFNDYVHPSLLGHERIAELACRYVP